jgi:hypothetical protein
MPPIAITRHAPPAFGADAQDTTRRNWRHPWSRRSQNLDITDRRKAPLILSEQI